jgi:hypothetical protein
MRGRAWNRHCPSQARDVTPALREGSLRQNLAFAIGHEAIIGRSGR